MKSEPDYKAAIDKIEEGLRFVWPTGRPGITDNAGFDFLACVMVDLGRMVRQGDNAVWPDPPDPDAEYDAAVDRYRRIVLQSTLHPLDNWDALGEEWIAILQARAARDAAKGKAVPK
jgi:hypothetical protein